MVEGGRRQKEETERSRDSMRSQANVRTGKGRHVRESQTK